MRIFIQSSAFLPTPAGGAGAVEYIVSRLAEGLARKHQVILFALEGSDVKLRTAGSALICVAPDGSAPKTEVRLVKAMEDAMVEFGIPDIIFDHSLTMLAQRTINCPAVSMSHGMAPLPEWGRNWVFTSKHHGKLHGVQDPKPLYLGIDIDYTPKGRDRARKPYLFWAGRILAYKQPHLAIDAAQAADLPLVIAGPIVDHEYAEKYLTPRLHRIKTGNHTVEMLGEIPHTEVLKRMREARAFLFTSDKTEPAGLVMLEALASGCPVVAFNHGANMEYLDGKVAILAETLRLDVLAFPIASSDCRAHVWDNFTIERMVACAEEYLKRAAAGGALVMTVVGTNRGHGHAWERPDGMKARCGGPALCHECATDLVLRRRERPWPGYCQACGAALDPPNRSSCLACGSSDEDET